MNMPSVFPPKSNKKKKKNSYIKQAYKRALQPTTKNELWDNNHLWTNTFQDQAL